MKTFNTKLRRSFSLLLLLPVCAATAQGSFQNLNFESARVSGYSPGDSTVPISAALPGWTGTYAFPPIGTNQTTVVWYDAISLGGAIISVNDTNTGFGFVPIAGKFSAILFSSGFNPPTTSIISQTGLVPVGTMSLQAKMGIGGPAPVVMLGGQVINMIPLAAFPTYMLYGGDASSFAGLVATLSFTEPPTTPIGSPSILVLDDIVFSPQQIPEPSGLALFSVSALLLGFFRRRNSSR